MMWAFASVQPVEDVVQRDAYLRQLRKVLLKNNISRAHRGPDAFIDFIRSNDGALTFGLMCRIAEFEGAGR